MRSSRVADASSLLGPLAGIAIALAAIGGVPAQDRKSLRCETILPGDGIDTSYFRKNCDDLKGILSNLRQAAPGLVSDCSAKAAAGYDELLNDAGDGVRPFIKKKVDEGLALLRRYKADKAEAPVSLVQLVRGYEEMAQDYDDALTDAALAASEAALARNCLPIAEASYRWVLTSFADPRHALIRQRAQAGFDDVRRARR
jgi:hypothetical protein